MQPDEELHTAVSPEAKFEPSPHTEKVFSLHSGKLLVHDTRKQVLYTLRTNSLGSGQTAQSKNQVSKQANKQKKGRHMYTFLNSYKTKCKVEEILQYRWSDKKGIFH